MIPGNDMKHIASHIFGLTIQYYKVFHLNFHIRVYENQRIIFTRYNLTEAEIPNKNTPICYRTNNLSVNDKQRDHELS